MKATKVFKNGGSLAVRLPKRWIGKATEVEMSEDGDTLVLRARRHTLDDVAEACAAEPTAIERPAWQGMNLRGVDKK